MDKRSSDGLKTTALEFSGRHTNRARTMKIQRPPGWMRNGSTHVEVLDGLVAGADVLSCLVEATLGVVLGHAEVVHDVAQRSDAVDVQVGPSLHVLALAQFLEGGERHKCRFNKPLKT